eukprot:1991256-Pyramimonas_sp.AAC.1
MVFGKAGRYELKTKAAETGVLLRWAVDFCRRDGAIEFQFRDILGAPGPMGRLQTAVVLEFEARFIDGRCRQHAPSQITHVHSCHATGALSGQPALL